MADYEFAGTLYLDREAMMAGIAYEYMTAGGNNSPEQIDTFEYRTPAEDAAEAINGWGLDQPDESGKSHMEANGYTAADLADAIAVFMATRPDRTP